MSIEALEVYATDSNYAVIKPPGRNFPGAVIQGDSLAILCRNALQVAQYVKAGDTTSGEFLEEIEDLTNALIGRMLQYQSVLEQHGIDFPHVQPFSESGLVELLPADDS